MVDRLKACSYIIVLIINAHLCEHPRVISPPYDHRSNAPKKALDPPLGVNELLHIFIYYIQLKENERHKSEIAGLMTGESHHFGYF